MLTKKETGSVWVDEDDAPLLTRQMRARAEVFEGDVFVPRKRGRPTADAPKEAVHLRLDQDVLTQLRASGPGWQTRVNAMLRAALGLN